MAGPAASTRPAATRSLGRAAEHAALGKQYAAFEYEVGREKIREFANAVGAANPVYLDRAAARDAGFRDVVAPPMFAVVYSAGSVGPAILDPEVGIDLTRMLHRAQEFEWGDPVCSGDVVTTTTTFSSYRRRGSRGIFVFESLSRNQDGQLTVRGTWTQMVLSGIA